MDVRLTEAFVDQVCFALDHVSPDEITESGRWDEFVGVRGFFTNAKRVFDLRRDADRIEQALRSAR